MNELELPFVYAKPFCGDLVGVTAGLIIVYSSPVTGFLSLRIRGVFLLFGVESHEITPSPVTGLRFLTSCFVREALRGGVLEFSCPNSLENESEPREPRLGEDVPFMEPFCFGVGGVHITWKISLDGLRTLFLL